MVGIKCPKHFWCLFNNPEKIPENTEEDLFIMNQGNDVGQLAKKMFNGKTAPVNFKLNIEKTQEMIKEKNIIYEAGIMNEDLYARADIMIPVDDEWDVIEVKSSTKVKDEHIEDASFQKYVYEKSGLKIRKFFIMYINRSFIKDGDLDVNEFFSKEEVTDLIDLEKVRKNISHLKEILSNKNLPDIDIRNGCKNGLQCRVTDCYDFLPENNIYNLYWGNKVRKEFSEKSIFSIKDIPDEKLNEKQKIQKKCILTDENHINKRKILEFLSKLKPPIHYIDFETFSTAIPMYENTKPYQQIPFQFSLIIENEKYNFLNDSKKDPRKEFLNTLMESSKDEGSVVVFNQVFEAGILRKLAEKFPEHEEWIDNFISRMADLLVVFRNFDFHNHKQKGSCSLKNVLPALTEKDYSDMEINNGRLAAAKYFDMIFKENDKEKIKTDLIKYCSMDAEAMSDIIDKLKTF